MLTARQARKYLEQENRKWPDALMEVPRDQWPVITPTPERLMRSRRFLVQIYREANKIMRLSVVRTELLKGGQAWADGIRWEELQQIKRECGYEDRYAVEVYPMDRDIVNVSNMRHLWVLPTPLEIGWRQKW